MNILYHDILCPLSKQVRFYLKELNIKFELVNYKFKQHHPQIARMMPILKLQEQELFGIHAIIEYLSETYQEFCFMDQDKYIRSNIRGYLTLCNINFYNEVIYIYMYEKIIKFLNKIGEPNTNILRTAKINLSKYLNYLSTKLNDNFFLTKEKISCADIAFATHISLLDYLNLLDWYKWKNLAHWYSLIKSQRGFQEILKDIIPGFTPSANYSKLDFA